MKPIEGAKLFKTRRGIDKNNNTGYVKKYLKLKDSALEEIKTVLNQMIQEIKPIIKLINKNVGKRNNYVKEHQEKLKKFTISKIRKKIFIKRRQYPLLYHVFYIDAKITQIFFNKKLSKSYRKIKEILDTYKLFSDSEIQEYIRNHPKLSTIFLMGKLSDHSKRIETLKKEFTETLEKKPSQCFFLKNAQGMQKKEIMRVKLIDFYNNS